MIGKNSLEVNPPLGGKYEEKKYWFKISTYVVMQCVHIIISIYYI